ncbi:MAG: hypothetical protein KGZ58_12755 [Ignavibacteriales bacterium]|nr:hypothetical protein [Ignavibacteriales bacterium]
MPKIRNNELSYKEKKFVKVVVMTGNLTEAACFAYNVKNRKSGCSIGAANNAKLRIRLAIENETKQLLDKRMLDETLMDIIQNSRKGNAKIRALRLAYELRGELKKDRVVRYTPDNGQLMRQIENALKRLGERKIVET